jgi:hypothetical protein
MKCEGINPGIIQNNEFDCARKTFLRIFFTFVVITELKCIDFQCIHYSAIKCQFDNMIGNTFSVFNISSMFIK